MSDPKKYIVHIDLDTFFVSVERLRNASLNGKPVLIGGSADRGVVASCSYEARKFGIHSAMPMRTARRLCPHAIIIRGDYDAYAKASTHVTEIIHETVPLYEKTSIDEFYIDLTGMDKFFDCYRIATDLRETIIRETGLPISFGLSSNKTVSKVATGQAKPNGQLYIPHGSEKAFLAPLPVGKIPMIGPKAYETLLKMGIFKVGDLQRHPLANLQRVFGKMGLMMWKKAQGLDHSEVIPSQDRKSISSDHTFHEHTCDRQAMEQLLISITEQLTYQLRKEHRVASCLTLKIRYSNFETSTHQITISGTQSDYVLFPLVKQVFARTLQAGRAVRLVGVRLSRLSKALYQADLFDNNQKNFQLDQALDQLNTRYGVKTISRAETMGISTREFNPFNGKVSG
jgi:DNA polymerase-4